ncbi:MAG: prepilin-type N-terminal cleavage/methylation domain-containing protein, partial [Candidatus Wallbacteria bacterium]|nr:prepilin-type N-terminal cleavage/methylation domain-containing protein [Candidatus Wallbacteria bacterium]
MNPEQAGQRTPRSRAGFSLMELVVAMVVLLILLPTAVPLYDRYLGDAREESLKQRLRELRRALSTFRLENGRYPNWLFDGFGNNVDFLDDQRSEVVQGVHDGPGTYPAKRRRYLAE